MLRDFLELPRETGRADKVNEIAATRALYNVGDGKLKWEISRRKFPHQIVCTRNRSNAGTDDYCTLNFNSSLP
jgi:hypothetical protein